jgi:hypothetical protein
MLAWPLEAFAIRHALLPDTAAYTVNILPHNCCLRHVRVVLLRTLPIITGNAAVLRQLDRWRVIPWRVGFIEAAHLAQQASVTRRVAVHKVHTQLPYVPCLVQLPRENVSHQGGLVQLVLDAGQQVDSRVVPAKPATANKTTRYW